MTTISLSAELPAPSPADALVVGVAKRPRKDRAGRRGRRRAAVGGRADGPIGRPDAGGALAAGRTLRDLGATGNADEVVRVPAPAGVAAAGRRRGRPGRARRRRTTPRRCAAPPARRPAPWPARRTVGVAPAGAGRATPLEAVAEGALLGAYAFTGYRGRTADQAQAPPCASSWSPPGRTADATARRGAGARASAVADAVALARDLVNTPPNDLPPADVRRRRGRRGRPAPASTVEVLDEKALRKGGYGGILGVGQGSAQPAAAGPARLPHPQGQAAPGAGRQGHHVRLRRHLAQAGAGMETMKSDMGGAAAVLAAMRRRRRARPAGQRHRLAAAGREHAVAARRSGPSDVLTMYGGKTVEVLNTDAEGRLVLADALVARRRGRPGR